MVNAIEVKNKYTGFLEKNTVWPVFIPKVYIYELNKGNTEGVYYKSRTQSAVFHRTLRLLHSKFVNRYSIFY
jgi:hypothetical protein